MCVKLIAMKKNVFSVVAMLLVNLYVFSQFSYPVWIDSIILSPKQPSAIDTIVLTAYTTHGTPTGLRDWSLAVDDTLVSIYSCYQNTNLSVVKSDTSSFKIGTLTSGYYKLLFLAKAALSQEIDSLTPCTIDTKYDTAILSFEVLGLTSTKSTLNEENIHLHPSPATHQLTLSIPPPTQPATATITDVNGRLLRKEQLLNATSTLNIAELPAGLYFIAVQNAGQRWVRRFVKQ
jgi:hypothetical protein